MTESVMAEIRRGVIQLEMNNVTPSTVRMTQETLDLLAKEPMFRSVWKTPEESVRLLGVLRIYGVDVIVDESAHEMVFA